MGIFISVYHSVFEAHLSPRLALTYLQHNENLNLPLEWQRCMNKNTNFVALLTILTLAILKKRLLKELFNFKIVKDLTATQYLVITKTYFQSLGNIDSLDNLDKNDSVSKLYNSIKV